MIRRIQVVVAAAVAAVAVSGGVARAQTTASLSGTTYFTDFNGLANGLPSGFAVNILASANSTGFQNNYNQTPTPYSNTGSGFRNVASGNVAGINGTSDATQAAAADRALGVRSAAGLGEAFTFRGQAATSLNYNQLAFDAQLLDVQPENTVYTVRAGVGSNPTSFVNLGTISTGLSGGDINLGSAFTSQPVSYNLSGVASLQNVGDVVTFQIAALSTTGGSAAYDVFAIDRFSLGFTPVPEPATLLGGAALGLWVGRAARRRLVG